MDADSDDDIASEDEEFEYQDSGADCMSGGDGDDQMIITDPPEARKLPYVVMNRGELRERQQRCIRHASELLCVSPEEGFCLLRAHTWDLERLQEAWFNKEAEVRASCGLATDSAQQVASSAPPGLCPICLESQVELAALDCGHGFCQDCWQRYLQSQVDEGKAAVEARCPQHKCPRVVPSALFRQLCDEERREKYEGWFMRSYVDDNPLVKWCTNPGGCPNAVELKGGDETGEIRCGCQFVWCWGCGEEAHKPADCNKVTQWNTKNSAESENISWIRANTKKCPKCRKPIEKNQGCNHMVCSRAGGCGMEFCWLCLGEWASHGTSTGGYYQCNIFDKQVKDGKTKEEDDTRKQAKHALDKYMFYFERFMDHDRGMRLTVKEEAELENQVQDLHDDHSLDVIELQFLYDGVRQVRACRRVLKWSYVFGYYLEDPKLVAEKNLFEHLQKQLEENTDNLHEMLEKELPRMFPKQEKFPDEKVDSSSAPPLSPAEVREKFMAFRGRVTNLTHVTQKFLAQILTDLGSSGRLTGSASAASGVAAS